ncbi:unnamed protein product [Adineta steineri]|uniref:UAS domain-containing protein n=1 Tax=Adineta steineri TaxID=433720 RepID=A0A814M7N0_9BILA|nr:unnamed protein product [Adineta steineri]
MDNDYEFSDDETSDNYNIFASKTSFNECHDDTNDADTFHACFAHRYDNSPSFFPGSLLDACKAAFNSQDINERRPLLIYIHHDKKKMIERLLENYIVWPWDITFESNRNRLSTIWETTFSTPLFNDFSVEKCPMLIGITRRPTEIKSWIPTSKYQFTSLLKGHTLIRSQEKSIMKTLLSELISDACESKVDRTEFFYECLQQRYERCPTLFNGYLPNVYELTSSLTTGKEYRPVLIYLHHDKSEFNRTICPITIIDCLLENFIIYSWDNTSELNQEIMEITWKEMFSSPFNLTFPFNQYPMIIGIMKLFEKNKGGLVTPQYEFIPLLNGDILARTQAKISREGFLKELALFQQEFVANEQALHMILLPILVFVRMLF